MLRNLHKEHDDIAGYIRKATVTDDQLAYILLDVRGKIALENGEMVIYLKCLMDAGEGEPFSLANMTQTFYLQ